MHACVCMLVCVCVYEIIFINYCQKKEDWHELENEKSYLTKHHKDSYSILYETLSAISKLK